MSKINETIYTSSKIESERKENGEWNRVLGFFKNKKIRIDLTTGEYRRKNKDEDESIVGRFIGTIGNKGLVYSDDRRAFSFKLCQITKITAYDVSKADLPLISSDESMDKSVFLKNAIPSVENKKNKKISEIPENVSEETPKEMEEGVKK